MMGEETFFTLCVLNRRDIFLFKTLSSCGGVSEALVHFSPDWKLQRERVLIPNKAPPIALAFISFANLNIMPRKSAEITTELQIFLKVH